MNRLITYLIFLFFLSFGYSQKIILYTKAKDVFVSSNDFTIENKNIVFWEDDAVLISIPISSLIKMRYATKTYRPAGTPCAFLGLVAMGSSIGAATFGYPDFIFSEPKIYELPIGVGGIGLGLYLSGKLLNFFGAKFGRDIIYYNLKQQDYEDRKIILESIALDLKKRKSKRYKGEFQYEPEGRKKSLFGLTWDGKKPWNTSKKKKPKKKILRFSFW
mgnify:FL=1|tara:strand:- start:174 stop:824 length:651 start_codon:yes stop_codon:yes gene_type:complete